MKKTANEWYELIQKIEDPIVRRKVSSIVWWDNCEDWDQPHPILKAPHIPPEGNPEPSPEALTAGLFAVGYEPKEIAKRLDIRKRLELESPKETIPFDSSVEFVESEAHEPVSGFFGHDEYLEPKEIVQPPVRVLNGSRKDTGSHSLMCTVCEQAADDVKALLKARVIDAEGRINPDWVAKNVNGVVQYRTTPEVQELMQFVMGGDYEALLTSIGITVDFKSILKALGLTVKKVA